MVDRALQHRRVHNLLLIQKLLACRGETSPLTLILDSVEQSAKPLIDHYISNAKASKTTIIYVSYETLKPPPGISTFIKARRKDAETVEKEILSAISSAHNKRNLLLIDTLYPLLPLPSLSQFLSSLLTTNPGTTLLATYHLDIPLPPPSPSNLTLNPYASHPLTLLKYLATAILTVHSFPQTLAKKRARDRSMVEPAFGIEEGREGVLVGEGSNAGRKEGVAVEMEFRRKSGRGVGEWFFLPPAASSSNQKITLLDDHPLFRGGGDENVKEAGGGGVEELLTFDLGLTDKQRRDREGVVLPYFDAQGGGGGEGGRILYEMGVEDDFDEEEDEI